MIFNTYQKWMLGFVFLTPLLTACTPQTAPKSTVIPTATKNPAHFADPFLYCATIGTIDAPDERYVGPAAPESVTQDLRKHAGIAEDAPSDWVAAGTVWRCMDNKVWACFVGANLPCLEKADTHATPSPQVLEFCKTNPKADPIPATVTGRATIYNWRCVDGTPQALKQHSLTPDAQGFLSNYWYESKK